MRKMLEGMRSFWNSVEVVGVVTRVFPMSCIQLSLLNIHQAIQPITVLFGSMHIYCRTLTIANNYATVVVGTHHLSNHYPTVNSI